MSSESTRAVFQWMSPVCCRPPASLWVDCTQMSAPAPIALSGRSGWKRRCPPHASSTMTIAWSDAAWTARTIARVLAARPS